MESEMVQTPRRLAYALTALVREVGGAVEIPASCIQDDARILAVEGSTPGGLTLVYLENKEQAVSLITFGVGMVKLRPDVFAIKEAALALLADVRARHPGEKLKCPHMIALAKSLLDPEFYPVSPNRPTP